MATKQTSPPHYEKAAEREVKQDVKDLYPAKGYTQQERASFELLYNHRCAEFREQYPEFGKGVGGTDIGGIIAPDLVKFEIVRLGNPALAHHLARDREWLQKLWRLTPYQQVQEVRRMHQEELKPEEADPGIGVRFVRSTKLTSVGQTHSEPRPKKGSPRNYQEFKQQHNAEREGKGHRSLLFS